MFEWITGISCLSIQFVHSVVIYTSENIMHLSSLAIVALATAAVSSAWDIRIIGEKGDIFEDKDGTAYSTKCKQLPHAINALHVSFQARMIGPASLKVYSDSKCEHEVGEQCANLWQKDYDHKCIGSYMIK